MADIYILVNKNFNTNMKVIRTDKHDSTENKYGKHQFTPLSYMFLPSEPSSGRTISLEIAEE
jgi:hypothetical protein